MNLDETYLIRDAAAPPASSDRLRIGAIEPKSLVAGPGTRAVVWVAGCLRRCPACMKPDLFSFEAGRAVAVEDLARQLLALDGIEAVTFSGGEPFEQALPLSILSHRLRSAGWNVLVYSGYRLEALRRDPARFRCLLDETDILIDGEYRHEAPGPFRWRGSINQHVHFFTHDLRLSPFDDLDAVQEVQATIRPETVRLSGFPDNDMAQRLTAQLAAKGIQMTPAPTGEAET